MEYAADAISEDHATLTFINCNLQVPVFTKSEKNGWLEIKTAQLSMRYKINSDSFNVSHLVIDYTMKGQKQTWNIGSGLKVRRQEINGRRQAEGGNIIVFLLI